MSWCFTDLHVCPYSLPIALRCFATLPPSSRTKSERMEAMYARVYLVRSRFILRKYYFRCLNDVAVLMISVPFRVVVYVFVVPDSSIMLR